MIPIVLLFWLLVALVAISGTWANYLARLASEKTIRQAIDKGLILDPAMIEQLRPTRTRRWDVRLMIPGILIFFAGLGVALFGVLLAVEDPEALFPMLSTAAFPTLTGLGFIVAAVWLRRRPLD